ncbi:PREDICTED: uncharacterized protein LOC107170934 [Diuraphis noxia]|uniref:uncharacterized protein LOC107170934 n=1 Tax=Diuraphis noxia TaxID=143948 RepID=UPI0007637BE9|nr:PREDICTED: uncharacterized protein LOC107170934 [Diuraphis noxia]
MILLRPHNNFGGRDRYPSLPHSYATGPRLCLGAIPVRVSKHKYVLDIVRHATAVIASRTVHTMEVILETPVFRESLGHVVRHLDPWDYPALPFDDIPEWKCRKLLSKANTTNTNSIVNQHGNQRERRQALVKTRNVDDGPGPVESFARSSYPLNVPRFQNGDVINYSTINMEVIKWIRQQLSIEKMNRIQEFKLKNLNRLSSSKTPQR